MRRFKVATISNLGEFPEFEQQKIYISMINMKIQITKALEHSNYVRENPGKMSFMSTQQIHSRFKVLTEEEIPHEERKKRDNMLISLNDQIRETLNEMDMDVCIQVKQTHSRFKVLTEEEIPHEERKKRDNMGISLNDQIRETRKWRILKEEDIPEDIRICRDKKNKI